MVKKIVIKNLHRMLQRKRTRMASNALKIGEKKRDLIRKMQNILRTSNSSPNSFLPFFTQFIRSVREEEKERNRSHSGAECNQLAKVLLESNQLVCINEIKTVASVRKRTALKVHSKRLASPDFASNEQEVLMSLAIKRNAMEVSALLLTDFSISRMKMKIMEKKTPNPIDSSKT